MARPFALLVVSCILLSCSLVISIDQKKIDQMVVVCRVFVCVFEEISFFIVYDVGARLNFGTNLVLCFAWYWSIAMWNRCGSTQK